MRLDPRARRRNPVALRAAVSALAIAFGGLALAGVADGARSGRFLSAAATDPTGGPAGAPSTASSTTVPDGTSPTTGPSTVPPAPAPSTAVPPARTPSTSVPAAAPAPEAAPANAGGIWAMVGDREGRPRVVRGADAAGLRPGMVTEQGDRVLSVEHEVSERDLETAASNDPLRPQQWALDATSFERAWSITRGSGVTVAVLDTGVYAGHEELGSTVVGGIDYIDPRRDGRYDPNGHGTHVAGIIAAHVNNARGIAGAAPAVHILPVRVLDAGGSGVSSNVAAGIIWAADRGARVVTMSLGGPRSDGMQIAMQYALRKNVVVLAAAGNDGANGNPPLYPAAYPEAIAVGASNVYGGRASFSTVGRYVDVSAPGENILSTWKGWPSSYAWMSGTSMSTPYAAAAVALIRSANRALSPASVTSILERTARDAGARGFDPEFGYGIVDPARAVLDAMPKPPGYGTEGRGYWIVGPNGRVRVFGGAGFYGNASGAPGAPVVASARTRSGRGYWLVAANGAVFSYGDARFYGSMGGRHLNAPIVAAAATPTGRGYILLGADGGIFTFGDARFYGSTGGMRLNARVLDLAMTRSGRGYWFVAADGGVFSFGDARFHGSTGGMRLSAPVTSMARATDGRGYWLVAADGGIFAFGVPFLGSLPAIRAITGGWNAPTVRMRAVASSRGYYLLGLDGSIAAFGTARFFGSAVPTAAVDLMLAP